MNVVRIVLGLLQLSYPAILVAAICINHKTGKLESFITGFLLSMCFIGVMYCVFQGLEIFGLNIIQTT